MDEHRRRLGKEMGRDPDFIDTFTRTFQKKDKTWSGNRAKAMKDKYTEFELLRTSSASSGNDGSEPSVGSDQLSLWLEASGGCKGGGRILGMGSLSRTYKVASSSSITAPAVTSQIHSLTEEVTHLKGLLMQRDQEMIQRDEQIRQTNQQMKQRDQEIIKLRRQQELILQHLQLPIPNDDGDGDDDHDEDDAGGSS